uniref:Uncharacterized protein n=1 Tax=Kalanchoe fedtschenkoi TaxID=63787 RepID=A0A7N0T3L5_KALFE
MRHGLRPSLSAGHRASPVGQPCCSRRVPFTRSGGFDPLLAIVINLSDVMVVFFIRRFRWFHSPDLVVSFVVVWICKFGSIIYTCFGSVCLFSRSGGFCYSGGCELSG